MADLLVKLKQRKLVQWALAYVAGAWALLQVLDLAAGSWHWPDKVMHLAFGVVALGLVITLLLAWYHGEQGRQRVTGAELLLIALALAIGGGFLWQFSRRSKHPDRHRRKVGRQAIANATPAIGRNEREECVGCRDSGQVDSGAAVRKPVRGQEQPVLRRRHAGFDPDQAGRHRRAQGDRAHLDREIRQPPGRPEDDWPDLGVATILEGSVQKAGDQVLVNVQLIHAADRSHIWAQ